jgi:4-hydroxy-4-methyl-2-oxoglutarate aldolase
VPARLPRKASPEVSEQILSLLRRTDTCTVSNAIESFGVRMRNEGFVHGGTRCMFPSLPPVAGYAVTGRIRTSAPPIANICYYNRMDFWEYLAALPAPKIMVMQDVDRIPGTGALFGEIHARIAAAFGCVAYVTNGTIRDLGGVKDTGIQCFAAGAGVSHSYAHVVEFGEPVEIGGLQISSGDLLHGDAHGVLKIPVDIVERLPEAVAAVAARESQLIKLCSAPGFSLQKLEEALKQEDAACHPPHHH